MDDSWEQCYNYKSVRQNSTIAMNIQPSAWLLAVPVLAYVCDFLGKLLNSSRPSVNRVNSNIYWIELLLGLGALIFAKHVDTLPDNSKYHIKFV